MLQNQDGTLRVGSKGPRVLRLQQALNYTPPTFLAKLNADGSFGQRTADRVKEFQKHNHLVPDGAAGSATLNLQNKCQQQNLQKLPGCLSESMKLALAISTLTTKINDTLSDIFIGTAQDKMNKTLGIIKVSIPTLYTAAAAFGKCMQCDDLIM